MKHRMHFINKAALFFIKNLDCGRSKAMVMAWNAWRHVEDSKDMDVWMRACKSLYLQEHANKMRQGGIYYNYRTAG